MVIEVGNNGLSCGDLEIALLASKELKEWIPLSMSPTDHCGELKSWLTS